MDSIEQKHFDKSTQLEDKNSEDAEKRAIKYLMNARHLSIETSPIALPLVTQQTPKSPEGLHSAVVRAAHSNQWFTVYELYKQMCTLPCAGLGEYLAKGREGEGKDLDNLVHVGRLYAWFRSPKNSPIREFRIFIDNDMRDWAGVLKRVFPFASISVVVDHSDRQQLLFSPDLWIRTTSPEVCSSLAQIWNLDSPRLLMFNSRPARVREFVRHFWNQNDTLDRVANWISGSWNPTATKKIRLLEPQTLSSSTAFEKVKFVRWDPMETDSVKRLFSLLDAHCMIVVSKEFLAGKDGCFLRDYVNRDKYMTDDEFSTFSQMTESEQKRVYDARCRSPTLVDGAILQEPIDELLCLFTRSIALRRAHLNLQFKKRQMEQMKQQQQPKPRHRSKTTQKDGEDMESGNPRLWRLLPQPIKLPWIVAGFSEELNARAPPLFLGKNNTTATQSLSIMDPALNKCLECLPSYKDDRLISFSKLEPPMQNWSPSDANGVTIVTALFSIRQRESQGDQHQQNPSSVKSAETYLELAKPLMRWSCYLVVFCEPHLASKVWQMRAEHALSHKTLVYPMVMEQSRFWTSCMVDRIHSLYQQQRIPYRFCPRKDTALYVFSQATKYDALNRVLQMNPFSSRALFWIDIGIHHVATPPVNADDFLKQLGRSRRIRQTHLRRLSFSEIQNKERFFSQLQQATGGGMIGGPLAYVRWLCDAFEREFCQALRFRPVLDEAILGSLALTWPNLTQPLWTGHKEMLQLRSNESIRTTITQMLADPTPDFHGAYGIAYELRNVYEDPTDLSNEENDDENERKSDTQTFNKSKDVVDAVQNLVLCLQILIAWLKSSNKIDPDLRGTLLRHQGILHRQLSVLEPLCPPVLRNRLSALVKL